MNPPKILLPPPCEPLYDIGFSEDLWKNLDTLLEAFLGRVQKLRCVGLLLEEVTRQKRERGRRVEIEDSIHVFY